MDDKEKLIAEADEQIVTLTRATELLAQQLAIAKGTPDSWLLIQRDAMTQAKALSEKVAPPDLKSVQVNFDGGSLYVADGSSVSVKT